MLTNLIVWILVGAFAGWLAGRVVRRHDFDFVRSIVVGLIGALFGGWLFSQLTHMECNVPCPNVMTVSFR